MVPREAGTPSGDDEDGREGRGQPRQDRVWPTRGGPLSPAPSLHLVGNTGSQRITVKELKALERHVCGRGMGGALK